MTSSDVDESAAEPVGVEAFFRNGGPLATRLEGYSRRPQQVEMARAVADAVAQGRHLAVEAGTGVGKSLGYLAPTLSAALRSGRRVLVSTHTISLQEQLLHQDLPLLQGLLERRFTAEVAKGRGNYLAPRRLELATSQASMSKSSEALFGELQRIGAWAESDREGTRQNLLPQTDPDVWELVQSEHGNCLGEACEFFATTCAYHAARRRLAASDLIVVNHSLLMADLALRAQGVRLLPDYDIVVLDEAHTVEGVAMEHFGTRVSRRMIQLLLARLCHPGGKRGFLTSIKNSDQAKRAVLSASRAATEFFEGVAEFVGSAHGTREIRGAGGIRNDLSEALAALGAEMTALKPGCESKEVEIEFQNYVRRLGELGVALEKVLDPRSDDTVHWAEVSPDKRSIEVHAKPVDVSSTLRDALFSKVRTVVLTSATLSIRKTGGLDWLGKALGIDTYEKLQVGSPFDYRECVTIRVPTYLNEPSMDVDYEERAANAIRDYIERSQGGAFVLFTSYEFMRRIHDRLAPRLGDLGFPTYLQGEDLPRTVMIERFKESKNSVLFGTDSFWQGVDVRGDALRTVILTRLPFPVPTQPLFRARADRIKARGGDPFRELSLPEAIIRFKQGFGRLIRTETDRGTIVVLDTRFLTKAYGAQFRDAVPPVRIIED